MSISRNQLLCTIILPVVLVCFVFLKLILIDPGREKKSPIDNLNGVAFRLSANKTLLRTGETVEVQLILSSKFEKEIRLFGDISRNVSFAVRSLHRNSDGSYRVEFLKTQKTTTCYTPELSIVSQAISSEKPLVLKFNWRLRYSSENNVLLLISDVFREALLIPLQPGSDRQEIAMHVGFMPVNPDGFDSCEYEINSVFFEVGK